jgi:hypothetical protein
MSQLTGSFHEIEYGGDAIEGDFDAIIFNPLASAELQTFEVGAKPTSVSLGLSRVKFGIDGNHTILSWQLK